MAQISSARYPLEFNVEAVRLVRSSKSIMAVSPTLGIADQRLHNWVIAGAQGVWQDYPASRGVPE